jgi:hypothetical protein
MHGPINVKSPNNTSKWQMGFNSAFKGLISSEDIRLLGHDALQIYLVINISEGPAACFFRAVQEQKCSFYLDYPPKSWYSCTNPHEVISQEMDVSISTAAWTSALLTCLYERDYTNDCLLHQQQLYSPSQNKILVGTRNNNSYQCRDLFS